MGSKLATLEQNWRRVASTHTLQDLLNADKPPEDKGPSIKIIIYGLGLILAGIACLTLGIVAFGARWIFSESSTDPVIQFLREDRYYHLLVPALVPVTIVAIFINWFSMKLFRHNSMEELPVLQFAQSPGLDMASYLREAPDYEEPQPAGREFDPTGSPVLLFFPHASHGNLNLPANSPQAHPTPDLQHTPENLETSEPEPLASLDLTTQPPTAAAAAAGADCTVPVQVPQGPFEATPKKPFMCTMGTQTCSTVATQTSPGLDQPPFLKYPTAGTATAPTRIRNVAPTSRGVMHRQPQHAVLEALGEPSMIGFSSPPPPRPITAGRGAKASSGVRNRSKAAPNAVAATGGGVSKAKSAPTNAAVPGGAKADGTSNKKKHVQEKSQASQQQPPKKKAKTTSKAATEGGGRRVPQQVPSGSAKPGESRGSAAFPPLEPLRVPMEKLNPLPTPKIKPSTSKQQQGPGKFALPPLPRAAQGNTQHSRGEKALTMARDPPSLTKPSASKMKFQGNTKTVVTPPDKSASAAAVAVGAQQPSKAQPGLFTELQVTTTKSKPPPASALGVCPPEESAAAAAASASLYDDYVCEICGDGYPEDTMLLCDECNMGFHMGCVKPALKAVPQGKWYCGPCRSAVVQKQKISSPATNPHAISGPRPTPAPSGAAVSAAAAAAAAAAGGVGAAPAAAPAAAASEGHTLSKTEKRMDKVMAGKLRHRPLVAGKLRRSQRAELQVLVYLGELSEAITEKDIRRAAGDNPDTSRAIRRLVENNLVIKAGAGTRLEPFTYRLASHAAPMLGNWKSTLFVDSLACDVDSLAYDMEADVEVEAEAADMETETTSKGN